MERRIIEDENGRQILEDKYIGEIVMENVTVKKYLGDIISTDGKNIVNIKE